MYFESQEVAEKLTGAVSAALVESSNQMAGSAPSHVKQYSADIVNVDLQSIESKSSATATPVESDPSPRNATGPQNRKTTRRKSLAEFQEINDAVGIALSEAESCDTGDANFDKAVGEQVETFVVLSYTFQIVALSEKPRKSEAEMSDITFSESESMPFNRPISHSLPPPPSASSTCRLPESRVLFHYLIM